MDERAALVLHIENAIQILQTPVLEDQIAVTLLVLI